ncbi:MAG TPA: cell division protein FtsL [Terriglobia bacterium]|nr:cell division protein FtsL [Terriglobia bacterium]
MATAAQALPATRRRLRQTLTAGRAPVREVYFTKHIDNSRIVREVDSTKRRDCLMLAAPLLAAFALLSLYAWQHFQCVRYGYLIEQVRQEQRALVEHNHELKVQEAALADPQRIGALAASELGLAAPDPRRVVNVNAAGAGPAPDGETQLAEIRPAPRPPSGGLGRFRW